MNKYTFQCKKDTNSIQYSVYAKDQDEAEKVLEKEFGEFEYIILSSVEQTLTK